MKLNDFEIFQAPRIGGSGTNAPIITLPDEEDDSDVMIEEDYGRGKR